MTDTWCYVRLPVSSSGQQAHRGSCSHPHSGSHLRGHWAPYLQQKLANLLLSGSCRLNKKLINRVSEARLCSQPVLTHWAGTGADKVLVKREELGVPVGAAGNKGCTLFLVNQVSFTRWFHCIRPQKQVSIKLSLSNKSPSINVSQTIWRALRSSTYHNWS